MFSIFRRVVPKLSDVPLGLGSVGTTNADFLTIIEPGICSALILEEIFSPTRIIIVVFEIFKNFL